MSTEKSPPMRNSAKIAEDHEGERCLKIMLTSLIFVSLLGLDIFWSLPGATLILEDIQEVGNWQGDHSMRNLLFVFNFRALGYAAGISIGLMFDMIEKQRYRILVILGLESMELLTCMAIPTSATLNGIAASFYSSGLSMSALDIVLWIYVLDIWKESSHPIFQCLQFFGSLGKLFGPLLARTFIPFHPDFEVYNKTLPMPSPEWNRAQFYPSVVFSYAVLSVILSIIIVLWICMFVYASGNVVFIRKYRENYEVPSEGFTVFAIFSTFLLFFITGTVDYGYQHVLPSLGYTLYGLPPWQALDLLSTFWGAYAIGALVAVAISLVFHPFAMLLLQLVTGISGSLVLMYAETLPSLFAGNAVLGFGLSNQRATAFLWLESFLHVNHKMLAVLFVGKLSAEMIIPVVLNNTVRKYGHRGVVVFLLLVPLTFSVVLVSQLVVFMKQGEMKERDGEECDWKLPIFVSRNRSKTHSA